MYYLLIFILTLTGFVLCHTLNSKSNQHLYLIITFIVLTLVATMRYSIGFDYFLYEKIYNDISHSTLAQIANNYTRYLGFAVLTKTIALTGANYIVFLLIINCIITGLVLWFIKRYSPMPWLSVALYIMLQFYAHSMNFVRQSLAASLLLLLFPLLAKRRLLHFVIGVFLIATIHISALILIPAYFFINLYPKYKNYLFALLVVVFLFIFDGQIFDFLAAQSAYISVYKNSYYWDGYSFAYLVFPTLYLIVTLYFKNQLMVIDTANRIFINGAFITFVICIFMMKHFILERFSIYFFIGAIVLIPRIVSLQSETKLKVAGMGLAFASSFIYFLYAASEGFHGVYPYVSLFQKP